MCETTLLVDDEFKLLVRPLIKKAFLALESRLRTEGCSEPIKVWRGYVVEDYYSYHICTRWNIPFDTTDMPFEYREEVIDYIAATQLTRKDLPEEARRYLIGKRFEAEKSVARLKNQQDWNLYTRNQDLFDLPYDIFTPDSLPRANQSVRNPTAIRLSREYSVSPDTIDKYGKFARALDVLVTKDITLIPLILSGRCTVAQGTLIALAKLPAEDVHKYTRKLKAELRNKAAHQARRSPSPRNTAPPAPHPALQTAIKNTPAPDPDSIINGLALTVPSWTNSIIRAYDRSDIESVSDGAIRNLEAALLNHQKTVSELLDIIRRDDNGHAH